MIFKVAHFEYEIIDLRALVVPPFDIENRTDIRERLINKELENISNTAQQVFHLIFKMKYCTFKGFTLKSSYHFAIFL